MLNTHIHTHTHTYVEYVCGQVCATVCVEVRRRIGFQELNSSWQAWQQVPFPSELYLWPLSIHFIVKTTTPNH